MRPSTIIVDPGLIAEAERLSESQRPRAISGEHTLPEAEQAAAGGASPDALDLSFEEAERYATAFRASWEPGAPAANGPTATDAALAREVRAGHRPVAAEPAAPRMLVSELPGANRRRTIALASAAVAGFVAIVLLGWLASQSGAPDHPSSDNPLANQAVAPVEPQAEAAKAPQPTEPAAPASPAVVAPAEPAPAVAEAPPSQVPATAPQPPLEAPPTAEVAPPPIAPAPAPPEPVRVALQITTRPSNARLTLDGNPIANPYNGRLPQGGSHVVQATAPDYEPRALRIELTKERSVALELERARAPEPPKANKPAKRSRQQRATKPAPAKKSIAFVEQSPY